MEYALVRPAGVSLNNSYFKNGILIIKNCNIYVCISAVQIKEEFENLLPAVCSVLVTKN